MDIQLIKDFIALAKKEGVSSLKYEGKELKVSVSLPVEGQQIAQTQVVPQTQQVARSPQSEKNSGYHEIKSPLVGTFYAQSSPNDPAFVKVGDKVAPGKTLCIVEAMKIMNEVESDVSGEIIEVLVENESLVEFGQPLFRIKKQ